LPNCWGEDGEILSQDVYNKKVTEDKCRTGAAPKTMTILKGSTITNFWEKKFDLLVMVKIISQCKLDYVGVINL